MERKDEKIAVYMRVGSASQIENKSVVLYVRESNHCGAEESLRKQKERLKEYCKQNGYIVANEVANIGSRADSLDSLKQAIEYANNIESKTVLMVTSNRVIGTVSELEVVSELIEKNGVKIKTLDSSYENAEKIPFIEKLIAQTIASVNEDNYEDN